MHFDGNILIDENLPYDMIDFFVKRKIKTEHLKKIGKTGVRNGEVYQYAEINKSWIITRDADFQSYFKFQKYNIGGVILFKTTITNKSFLLKSLEKFWNKYSGKLAKKLLVIIEDDNVSFLE